MPVAAGVIAVLHLLAIRADIHLPAQRFGSAGFNGLHGLQMLNGEVSGVFLAIGRPALAHYFSQLYPHKRPTSRLIAATAGASTCGVRCV